MKKIFLATVAILGFMVTGTYAGTLYDYYTNVVGYLPSVEQRQSIAERCGIANYRGVREQNIALLSCLETMAPSFVNLRGSGGIPVTNYSTTLTVPITSATTSIAVATTQTFDDHQLVVSDIAPAVYLVINAGGSTMEIIKCTDVSSTHWAGCTRGLAFWGKTETSVTANQQAHAAAESVEISDVHFYTLSPNDNTTFTANQTFGNATATNASIVIATTTTNTARIYLGSPNGGYFERSATSSKGFWCQTSTNCTDLSTGGSGTGVTFVAPLTNAVNEGVRIATSTATAWFATNGSGQLIGNASSTGGILADTNGIALDEDDAMDWDGRFNFNGDLQINDITVTSTARQLNINANVTSAHATNTALLMRGTDNLPQDANNLHFHGVTYGREGISGTGNTVVTHNLGRTPTHISFTYFLDTGAADGTSCNGAGSATSTTNGFSAYACSSDGADNNISSGFGTSTPIFVADGPGTALLNASVSALNATTFTINTATKAAAIGTVHLLWIAQ